MVRGLREGETSQDASLKDVGNVLTLDVIGVCLGWTTTAYGWATVLDMGKGILNFRNHKYFILFLFYTDILSLILTIVWVFSLSVWDLNGSKVIDIVK
jgi:hypothetical protein